MRTLIIRTLCLLPFLAPAALARDASTATPWGIASSASANRNHAQWLPRMSAAGITTVRLFPEWRSLEPAQNTWRWDSADALVKAAADNKIEISAIFMGSTPWTKAKAHAFPMDHLDDWSAFVSAAVARYKDQIRYWEVWNEGNGGFNDDHSTTTDYARLAAATYGAAKRANPNAQVGLTVASFDPAYLNQAILAMAKDGKPDSFDYLCIHPYEVADGLADPDGEIPYLWMTRTVRDMLKSSAPRKANAEIWITEVSRRVESRKDRSITEADAAIALVKLYTMSIAQGIQRTQWFEAQDPIGEDQGFGLINRAGAPRASYKALASMTKLLGPTPKYLGWLALGQAGRGYGFVFQGASTPVLIAWMPAGETDKSLSLPQDADLVNPLTGAMTKSTGPIALTDSPILATGLPAALISTAQANAAKNFPWGGDHSAADTVSVTLGQPDRKAGIFQVARQSTPHCTFPDGSTGLIVRGDQSVSLYVHPSFAGFNTKDYYVRLTVRRLAPGNVGMNLFYETADSQGRTPYKNKGEWYSVPAGDGWHTHTWHITDACFAKMWGYDISFRPEQSVPFVIGKVEVSTKPF